MRALCDAAQFAIRHDAVPLAARHLAVARDLAGGDTDDIPADKRGL
jgi:hypothetical protein